MTRLPVATGIEPDELLAGAVARAAAENGRRFPSEVLALVGIETHHPASIAATLDAGAADALALLVGADASAFTAALHSVGEDGRCEFFGTRIRNKHREGPIRRVSPRGLAEKPYVRAIWQLKPLSFDPHTKELLISTCPECGANLGFSRTFGVCHCDRCGSRDDMGFMKGAVDLREFPQPTVEIEDMAALDFVTGLVDPDPEVRCSFYAHMHDDLSGLTRGELFDLTLSIVGVLDQDPSRAVTSPAKATTRANYEKLFTPERLAQGGRIMLDWERGFDELCDRARATSSQRPGFYGVKAELGQVYSLSVDRTLTENARSVAKAAVERNMGRTSQAFGVRRVEHRGRVDLVTTEDAATRYGIHRRIVTRLGLVDGVTTHRPEGATKGPVLFVAEEIAAIAALRGDLEASSSVGRRLGIPNGAVAKLAEAGLIERVTGPVLHTVVGKVHYRKSSVDALVSRLEGMPRGRPVGHFHIRLSKAMYRLPAGEKPWSRLIEAVLDGTLPVFEVNGRLNATLIRMAATSFEAVAAAVGSSDTKNDGVDATVTRAEAADILGVKVQTVIDMVAAGLIPKHGPGSGVLFRNEVLAAASQYITTAEISRALGIGYRWVRQRLATGGIEPLHALEENRALVFDRSDVTRFLETAAARGLSARRERGGADDFATHIRGGTSTSVPISRTAQSIGSPTN